MTVWVLTGVLWCFSRLPVRAVLILCRMLARRMVAWNVDAARISAINIDMCLPHLSSEEKREICWQSLMNSMLLIFEIAQMRFRKVAQVREAIVSVDGAERLHQAWQHGQGVLLLTPHLGCWEILGAYLGGTYPVSALYDRPNFAPLGQPILDARQRFGATMHSISGAGLRRIMRAMREGHLVVLLPDQVPDYQSGGEIAPFFGKDAYTMALAHRLLQRNAPKVLIASALRRFEGNDIRYHLMFQEPEPAIFDADPAIHAAALNLSIEKAVLTGPEQYQWSYKRFKRLERGEANIYRRQ
ncbi:MAG TPA: hypothetical protein DHU16_05585 [Gammaproteobacteria bacterium]|nr:hypothetical protein [Gammaproteobacteria bacterium]HCY04905.1 hypothetical protein [Gammaproteobacteria bacterium]|tara:strand:- start:5978 stop:6874 length:897 start_codon:yes stop_codon:yes gene_type:complete